MAKNENHKISKRSVQPFYSIMKASVKVKTEGNPTPKPKETKK